MQYLHVTNFLTRNDKKHRCLSQEVALSIRDDIIISRYFVHFHPVSEHTVTATSSRLRKKQYTQRSIHTIRFDLLHSEFKKVIADFLF